MAESLSRKQRKYLQLGVLALLGIFLAVYFIFYTKKAPTVPEIENTSVYIENSVLYAFDDTISIAQYPNRVSMHYPYLLVIKPAEKKTIIYNLSEKKKATELSEAILDYTPESVLKNDGKTSLYNDKDLGILCDDGYIKSQVEVLCLTKVNPNNVENKLISIDITSNKKKDIYVSKNIITDFSLINDQVYIAELDLFTKKNSILVNNERIESPTTTSLFYQMDGSPYFASLKSELNGNVEQYYLIENDKVTQQQDKIYLLR